eukprot:GHVU01130149.1.p1 GENE.GHVU01130149.1~~GHVU01130149.1.p1  ORF type:complete len:107 (+),score=3.87 GHVU01130149.1:26-346(+)
MQQCAPIAAYVGACPQHTRGDAYVHTYVHTSYVRTYVHDLWSQYFSLRPHPQSRRVNCPTKALQSVQQQQTERDADTQRCRYADMQIEVRLLRKRERQVDGQLLKR